MSGFKWPQRECLHDNASRGSVVKNWQGETVKGGVPSPHCLDCGYTLPDEDYENPVGEIPDVTREDLDGE